MADSTYRGGGSQTSRRRETSPYTHPELAPGATPATPYNNGVAAIPLDLMLKNVAEADVKKKKKKRQQHIRNLLDTDE
jgi:hypothetical protein